MSGLPLCAAFIGVRPLAPVQDVRRDRRVRPCPVLFFSRFRRGRLLMGALIRLIRGRRFFCRFRLDVRAGSLSGFSGGRPGVFPGVAICMVLVFRPDVLRPDAGKDEIVSGEKDLRRVGPGVVHDPVTALSHAVIPACDHAAFRVGGPDAEKRRSHAAVPAIAAGDVLRVHEEVAPA